MTVEAAPGLSEAELEVARRSPLFADLPDELVDALVGRVEREELGPHRSVFAEGEAGRDLFIVLQGRVVLSVESGERQGLLAVLDPGDIFGELSLFDPGPRTSTARTLAPTVLGRVSREDLLAWATGSAVVTERLLRVLARRLRRTNGTLRDLIFTDVPGRVAGVLVDLTERYGQPGEGADLVVAHGLTQEQLARLVGTSREGVNKALSDFAQRGLVTVPATGRLVVHDRETLARRARRVPVPVTAP